MDGLSISNSKGLLQGKTFSELRQDKMSSIDSAKNGESFVDTLNTAINKVNETQKVADVKMEELATGQNTNIPEVMISVEKADIALRLMMKVRNKVIDAYQEIMKMQV